MARNRAHRFLDSFTQSCGLPANLFAGESNVMGGSDSDLAVLFEPIVLGVCNLQTLTGFQSNIRIFEYILTLQVWNAGQGAVASWSGITGNDDGQIVALMRSIFELKNGVLN
nr:hypothetical protein Iba_chr14aCG4670 [Ipomoea batatas]